MARVRSFVLAALLFSLVAGVGMAGPLEVIRTDRNVAVFYNTEARTYVGLRVVFSGPIEPISVFGVGAHVTWGQGIPSELRIAGVLDPLAACEIDWALGGPTLVDAYWILPNGTESAIDVHQPFAQIDVDLPPAIRGFCSPEVRLPFLPIEVRFSGAWSSDPDGDPIVRYEWTWSDGVTAVGREVFRTFRVPGWYAVSLVVWDGEGKAGTAIQTVRVPRYRCPT